MTTTTGGVLGGAFDFLITMGFLNTLVPFILYYAIVFGMLERTQIFTPKHKKEKDDKQITNLNALIAFAIAITATAASQAVGITQNYLPILSVTAVILLGVMMLLGMAFGDQFEEKILDNKIYKGIVWGGAFTLILGALIVVGYHSGLLVTPCTPGSGLTPVNSLNPAEGECTQMMDITQFPNKLYVLGMEVMGMLAGNEMLEAVIGLVIMGVFIAVVIYAVTKGSKK